MIEMLEKKRSGNTPSTHSASSQSPSTHSALKQTPSTHSASFLLSTHSTPLICPPFTSSWMSPTYILRVVVSLIVIQVWLTFPLFQSLPRFHSLVNYLICETIRMDTCYDKVNLLYELETIRNRFRNCRGDLGVRSKKA